MEINITLWIVGIVFTLSILAIKTGFGLGFSRIRYSRICWIFFMYLVLFVLITMLSGQLIKFLEPVLRKGPYLHAGMAIGMIAWGMYVIWGLGRQKAGGSWHAVWLIFPCPVCLSAITFCSWAVLGVIKLPAPIVGLGLGCAFVLLSLLFLVIARLKKSTNSQINLGLTMITIGCYFLASLIIQAKIEEAKGIYKSFITETGNIDLTNSIGVFALLFSAMLIGFFVNIHHRDTEKKVIGDW